MSRLILLLAAVALVWWWLSSRRRALRSDEQPKQTPPAQSQGSAEMVSCAHCGVHLPQSDALQGADGAFFCGEEHRRLGPGPAEKP